MKSTRFLFAAFLVLMVLPLTASAQKETRDVKNFTEVGFAVPGDLYVQIGSAYSVVIEGDADFLKKVVTEVRGTRLIIKTENSWNTGNNKIIVHVTMPSVEGLSLSGSGKIFIESPLKGSNLSLAISGSGKMMAGDISYQEMSCSISGSGSFGFSGTGKVTDADLSISGSGDFNAPGLEITNLEAGISGSGSCDCFVTGKLEARISGSGDVLYSGNPRIDVSSSGSGKVRSK